MKRYLALTNVKHDGTFARCGEWVRLSAGVGDSLKALGLLATEDDLNTDKPNDAIMHALPRLALGGGEMRRCKRIYGLKPAEVEGAISERAAGLCRRYGTAANVIGKITAEDVHEWV